MRPPEPARTPEPRSRDGIRRNALFALAAQSTSMAFTAVLTLFLVRALGPSGFGVFSLALAIGGLAVLLAEFGISHSLGRYAAENRGDPEILASVLRGALTLTLASAGLVATALFLAAAPIAQLFGEPELTWPLRGIAISVFFQAVLALCLSFFVALGRIGVNVRLVLVEGAVETGASIALVAAGAAVTGAAFGRSIGYAVGAFVAVAVVAGRLRGTVLPWRGRPANTARLMRYALPLFVTNSAFALYARIDTLILAALAGPAAVGIYTAPVRLTVPFAQLGTAIADSVAPRQARSASEAPRTDAFRAAVRWAFVFQAIAVAPLIVWAEPIVVVLLGEEFRASAEVLRLLVPFVFLRMPSPVISLTVNFLGQAHRRIPLVLAALATDVVLALVLIPAMGASGAAVSTSVAYAIYVAGHLRLCHRELGLPFRPVLTTIARALSAACAMGLALYLIGSTYPGSLLQAALAGAVGLIAYAGTLVVTGELSRRELKEAARSLSARLSGSVARA